MFTGDDPLNETDPLGSIVNQGPGEPMAGVSSKSAVAADKIDYNDFTTGRINDEAAYNKKADSGPISPWVAYPALAIGLFVPGLDDGPDEAAIAAEAEGSSAVADGSIDASELQMTSTVEQHIGELAKDGSLARPYADSTLTIQNIIAGGTPVPDPGGVPGALRWDVPGSLNGSSGTWQLVVDTQTKTILHFLFTSG